MMGVMPKTKTKTTSEHYAECEPNCTLTERGHQGFWLKLRKCPSCKTKGRLLAGPSYDRWKLACQHCGHRFRLKQPPEGFTR